MRKLKSVFLLVLLAISVLGFIPSVQSEFGSGTIFWETGIESGNLDVFDYAGTSGNNPSGNAGVEVSTTHVRSGDYSIRMYQPDNPKSDADRRTEAGYLSHSETEFYFSFWAYFPTGYDDVADASSWLNTGGLTLYWGDDDSDDGRRWAKGLRSRFTMDTDGTGLFTRGTWTSVDSTGEWDDRPSWNEGDKHYLTLNEWHQFQIYLKVGESDGIITTWIDNVTNLDLSNQHTDPAYWNEPEETDTWSHYHEFFAFGGCQYGDADTTPALEVWYDDIVASTEMVPVSYAVNYTSIEFEDWEDGFESGDFSKWNGTQNASGGEAPSVTSTYTKTGTYSANFTTDGSQDSYSRAMHIVQDANEIYQRSYIRLEDLPDANDTVLWLLRVAQSDGTWISSAGINMTDGLYYWNIEEVGGTKNSTLDVISADDWNEVEYYFNATTNGNATLWVNGTLMCEMTGDFSDDLARVYPYLYCNYGSQASAKTVYHDDYKVANERIGSGTISPFQARLYFSAGGEGGQGGTSPLQWITINGTGQTDQSGFYEWSSLEYNNVYTFVIGNATGYYPAWMLNVDGSFSWNGTHYIVTHNVTESHTGYIQIHFNHDEEPYIQYSNVTLTSASITSTYFYLTANDTGTGAINVSLADRGEPHTVTGLAGWNFDSSTNIFSITVTFSSSQTISLFWGSIVGTSLVDTATKWNFQRKTFYAQTRFWVFYSDGQNLVYRSSTDGTTWGNSTIAVTGLLNGENFSLVYESPLVHYIASLDTNLTYRRGEPLSNGSIIWDSSETVDSDPATTFSRPYICLDSDGYPWLGYVNKSGGEYYPYVSKSSTKDGTWTMDDEFPHQLSNYVGFKDWVSIPTPTNSKMYAIYTRGGFVLAQLYTTAWGTEEVLMEDFSGNASAISVTSYGSTVNIVKMVSFSSIWHLRYDGNVWHPRYRVVSGIPIFHSELTQFENKLYLFWESSGVVYLRRYVGQEWEQTIEWLDESSVTYTTTSFFNVQSNRVGLLWTDSSKTVMFAWFYTTTSGNFLLEGFDGVTVSSIAYDSAEGKLTFTSTGSGSAIVRGTDPTLTVLVNGSAWSSWSSDQTYITISALSGTSNIALYSVLEEFPTTGKRESQVDLDLDEMEIFKPVVPPLSIEGLYVIIGGVGIFVVGAFYTKITKTRTRGISKPSVPRISKPRGIQHRATPRKKAPRKPKKSKRSRRFV